MTSRLSLAALVRERGQSSRQAFAHTISSSVVAAPAAPSASSEYRDIFWSIAVAAIPRSISSEFSMMPVILRAIYPTPIRAADSDSERHGERHETTIPVLVASWGRLDQGEAAVASLSTDKLGIRLHLWSRLRRRKPVRSHVLSDTGWRVRRDSCHPPQSGVGSCHWQ